MVGSNLKNLPCLSYHSFSLSLPQSNLVAESHRSWGPPSPPATLRWPENQGPVTVLCCSFDEPVTPPSMRFVCVFYFPSSSVYSVCATSLVPTTESERKWGCIFRPKKTKIKELAWPRGAKLTLLMFATWFLIYFFNFSFC